MYSLIGVKLSSHFFQPEDGTKGSGEEDAFDGGECNHAFAKLAVAVTHHLRAHCAFRWTHGTVLIA